MVEGWVLGERVGGWCMVVWVADGFVGGLWLRESLCGWWMGG